MLVVTEQEFCGSTNVSFEDTSNFHQDQLFPYVHNRKIGRHENFTTARVDLSHELAKVAECGKDTYLFACPDCGEKREIKGSCNSRLCPRCSIKQHKYRSMRAFKILSPYLRKYYVWSHYVFTLPKHIGARVHEWEDMMSLRKTAYRISQEITRGKGGLATVHTFSSEDESSKHVHVHVIIMGRGFHNWEVVKRRWGKYLKRRWGYEGEVVVHEEVFLKGREKHRVREAKLMHKVKYVLRLPIPGYETYQHYRLLMGRQGYCYFGLVIADFRYKEELIDGAKVVCGSCGSGMALFGMVGSWYDSWLLEYLLLEKWPEKWKNYAIRLKDWR